MTRQTFRPHPPYLGLVTWLVVAEALLVSFAAYGQPAGAPVTESTDYHHLMDQGRAMAQSNRIDEAAALFQRAAAADPSAATPWANLGTLAAREERYELAEQCFREALARSPFQRDMQLRFGEVLLRRGKSSEAKQLADQLMQAHPNDREAINLLLRALDAMQAWSEIISRFSPVLKTEGKRVNPDLWAAVITALINSDRYEEAVETADLLASRHPDEPRFYHLRGAARVALARYRGETPPLDDYEEALRRGTLDEHGLEQLAGLQYEAGRTADLRETVERMPETSSQRAYWSGVLAYLEGNFASAAGLFQSFCERSPDTADGWLWLARALVRAGQPGEAEAAVKRYETAFSLERELKRTEQLLARQSAPDWLRHLSQAGVLRKHGQYDQALSTLRLAQELVGPQPAICAEAVTTLAAAGRVEEASQVAAECRSQWPEDGDIRAAQESIQGSPSKDKTPSEPGAAALQGATWSFPLGMYVGSQACAECHPKLTQRFMSDARHARAVVQAEPDAFLGDLDGSYSHSIAGATYTYDFEVNDREVYLVRRQIEGGVDKVVNRVRVDYVVGTGKQGQSFWSWPSSVAETTGPDPLHAPSFQEDWLGGYEPRPKGDETLLQLPVSYYVGPNAWLPSPSAQDVIRRTERFALRVSTERCVQCHAGYLNTRARGLFGEDVLEVGCEACHGPGADHIRHWRGQPAEAAAYTATETGSGQHDPTIANPARFDLDRRSDVCARCHNNLTRGAKVPADRMEAGKASPHFLFRPGDRIEDLFEVVPSQHVEQHTEKETLEKSRCFQLSPGEMTCETCHPPHHDPPDLREFSNQACLSCHNPDHGCLVTNWALDHFRDSPDCVACHMETRRVEGTFGHGTFVNHEIVRFREE